MAINRILDPRAGEMRIVNLASGLVIGSAVALQAAGLGSPLKPEPPQVPSSPHHQADRDNRRARRRDEAEARKER